MVGGLYSKGDDRRDKGFYVFYIGINLGAFLGALAVGIVAAEYGWHYGFGLAGIGMALGQVVYMFGLKYLEGVGEFLGKQDSPNKELMKKPLTKVEKDRMLVMFLSFLIIIVFWGAFEQAGGLMSLYTEQKTDRLIPFLDYEVPAATFQSVNAFFIIVLGTLVGNFWYKWGRKGKESSSLFKMAIGVIIMAFGFFFMSKASTEVVMETSNQVLLDTFIRHQIYLIKYSGGMVDSATRSLALTQKPLSRALLYYATKLSTVKLSTKAGRKLLAEFEEEIKEIITYRTQRVVIPLQKTSSENYNYLLQAGDIISIPKQKDVVEIILKANKSGKFKYVLNTTYYLWAFELLIDVYESCGFSFPEEHKLICIDNHYEYF